MKEERRCQASFVFNVCGFIKVVAFVLFCVCWRLRILPLFVFVWCRNSIVIFRPRRAIPRLLFFHISSSCALAWFDCSRSLSPYLCLACSICLPACCPNRTPTTYAHTRTHKRMVHTVTPSHLPYAHIHPSSSKPPLPRNHMYRPPPLHTHPSAPPNPNPNQTNHRPRCYLSPKPSLWWMATRSRSSNFSLLA